MRFVTTVAAACLFFGAATQARAEKLGLEQVIREVCANSDSVKMMKETLAKADQLVQQNWSAALPKVSGSVSAGRGAQSLTGGSSGSGASSSSSVPGLGKTARIDTGSGGTPASGAGAGAGGGLDFASLIENMKPLALSSYSAAVQVSQPIFTFGKVGTAIHVANQFDKSAQSSFNRGIQQLQLTALDAFYRVVLSEISLDIAKRSFSRKKDLYEFLERNFNLGSGSKAQLLAAKADMKSQVPAVTKAEQDLSNARMTLNMFMGHPLLDPVDLDTASIPSTFLSIALPPQQEAVKTAIDKREDLRSLEFLAEANRGGAKIYRAMYLPSIGATGSFGSGGTEPKDLVEWDRRTWLIGLGMQWTLFDGFASGAKARQYLSDAHKLEIARDAISKSVEIEVATDLNECVASDSNQAASDEALAAAQESYDLTNDNFKQGSGQITDLQLAEERLLQAEMGCVNAHYRKVRSRAALLVAMGSNIVDVK